MLSMFKPRTNSQRYVRVYASVDTLTVNSVKKWSPRL